MNVFLKHYQRNLSPEEFFDIVYQEHLHRKIELGSLDDCIQQLDRIRRKFDTYSAPQKADVSYGLREIAEKYTRRMLETQYLENKGTREEMMRLYAITDDLTRITKDLVQKNETLREELQAMRQSYNLVHDPVKREHLPNSVSDGSLTDSKT